MDIQRIVILIGLAVTAWLLLQAWQEDYGAAGSRPANAIQKPAPVERVGADASDRLSVPGISAVPELVESTQTATSVAVDIPQAVPQLDTAGADSLASVSSTELITVRTGVHIAKIDLRGGDLVSVALPQHLVSLESQEPFVLVDPRNNYAAQSGLIGPSGIDGDERPLYSSSRRNYDMGDNESLRVELTHRQASGATIRKVFTFYNNDYLIDIDFEIDNAASVDWRGAIFAQIRRDAQAPQIDESVGFAMQPYVGGAVYRETEPYTKIEFEDIEEEPFKEKVGGGYAAMVQHYFVTAFVPRGKGEYTYQGRKLGDRDLYTLGFTGPLVVVPAGSAGSVSAQYYAGPKDQLRLEQITEGLDLTVDYGFLWWLAQPLFYLLNSLHEYVGNWGLAIILLTCIVKLVLYPLSAAGYRSMAKTRMLQPQMMQLKERYGDDRQAFSQAMMDLYKKEGANPVGGCFPLLLQMPVFLALYWALMESVELRHAPFMLWIHDLSAMDPYFVLPILFGISMYLTTAMQPEPPDPMQAKVLKMMPVMFSFFFLWFPAGLVLYWLVNNILSVAQQFYVTKQIERANASG